jgi:hypothetical protein
MPTLWNTLLRRWLDPPGELLGLDHLCDHLRRDIGLIDAHPGPCAPECIRYRNIPDIQKFSILQESR